MARKRPRVSDVLPPGQTPLEADGAPDLLGLTHAEAHALKRCAPLTPGQFKALGQLAERGISPIPRG